LQPNTLSHYYCLEEGQNAGQFREDLKAAIRVAESAGVAFRSIVFPRNQLNLAYLQICRDFGLIAYRGNPRSWMYQAKSLEAPVKRATRLLDTYMPLSGHNGYAAGRGSRSIIDLPASRFLRPYTRRFPSANRLQVRRILFDLSYAAKNNLVYHL